MSNIDNTMHTNNTKNEEIRIMEIITKEITVPSMDGTCRSALYAIPFKLSKHPSETWKEFFLQAWHMPPKCSSNHRPGIAKIHGDKIILDGTTIEEVEKYHKETLQLCVAEANEREKAHLRKVAESESLERDKVNNHNKRVAEIANRIKFD